MNIVFKSFSWLLFEKIIVMAVLFSINIYIMRVLGPDQFGQLAFFQLVIGIMIALLDLGFRRVYISQSSKHISLKILPYILKYKLYLSSFIAFLLSILVGLGVLEEVYLLLLIIIIFSPLEVYSYYYESNLNHKRLVKIRLAVTLIISALRVVICMSGWPLYWLILTYTIQMPISNLISYFFFKVDEPDIKTTKKNKQMTILLSNIKYRSLFFWLSFLVVQLHLRSDQISIKALIDFQSLGFYVAAYKFVEQLLSLASMASNVFLPYVSKMAKSEYDNYLVKVYTWGLLASLPISITVYFASELIISVFLGNEYKASVLPLKILGLSLPVLVLSNLSGLFYSLNKLERFAFIRNVAGCLVSFIVCWLTIPYMGIEGAAVAVLISYFIVSFIIELFIPSCRRNIFIKMSAIKELLSLPKNLTLLIIRKRN